MPVLHQHVGGYDGAPVGDRHHRSVVTRAERDGVGLRSPRHQPIDDDEFPGGRQGVAAVVTGFATDGLAGHIASCRSAAVC